MRRKKRAAKRRKAPPNLLRHYREARLLSRAKLAAKAGVSISVIGKIENRTTKPTLTTKGKLLEGLGMRVEEAELVFPAA